MKILMVCLGNICRSPLAEGILRQKLQSAGLNVDVDSAGTGGWHVGEAPHKLSQNVAMRHNIDISGLRGRKFTAADMHDFDKIYVMDSENYNDVRFIAGKDWDENKVDLILNRIEPGKNKSVPDPWFDNTHAAFENVYQMLNQACDSIVADLKSDLTI
ncbi:MULTISPECIES: low molecular weight protein-tyrosine-phosphatase [Chitinophagaceae]